MRDKFKFILIISLLIVSTGIISTNGSINTDKFISETNLNTDKFISETNLNTDLIQSDTYTPVPEEKTLYVFFARNDAEYNDLLSLNPDTVYSNLRAVVLEQYPSDIELFETIMPNRVFPYSSYKIATIDEYGTASSGIVLNNGPDAGILDVQRMWDAGYNGANTVVAIFDNGVNTAHPGLEGQVIETYNINNYNGQTYPVCQDHGTPVAGTVAATGKQADGTTDPTLRGMAYGAKLISIGIGCHPDGYLWGDLLGGFDYIISKNATIDVVNTSWGGGNAAIWVPVLQKLADVNIILAGSSGNDGELFTSGGPGASVDAVSVGAIGYDLRLTDFSSGGPVFGSQYKPDVVAPGANVITTLNDGTYGPISGTSFSSPLTAGALATLISALKADGIKYNVGLLKAAIMRTASTIGISELTQGKGIVQTYKAYDMIKNAALGSDGMPMIVEMAPRLGNLPISYFSTIFTDITLDLSLTVIASHMGDVSISVTGNLADILTIDSAQLNASRQSQILTMKVDTTGIATGTYTGNVEVSLGSDKVSASYTFEVKTKKASILMDTGHTTWDSSGADVIGGSNTGAFIQAAFDKGIWVEMYDGEITSAKLNNYDAFWMPDPMGIDFSDPSDPDAIRANPLLDSEITAIVDYVKNGGSFFTDFNGLLYNEDAKVNVGTNPAEMNRLMSNFGIALETTAVVGSGPLIGTLNNFTSPVGSSKYLSHYGNFLTVSGDAKAIATQGGGITTAIYDVPGEGRVMATSTNFWMDNSGMAGDYAAGTDDRNFAKNTLDWLISSTQVKFISSSVVGTTIKGSFQVLENGVAVSTAPTIEVLDTDFINATTITPTSAGNGIWEFTYEASSDGEHILQVVAGYEYARWDLTVDTNAPSVKALDSNPNPSVLDKSSSLFLYFEVKDEVSTLYQTSFSFKMNDNEITSEDDLEHTYKEDEDKLIVWLHEPLLGEALDHIYELTIIVIDEFENKVEFIFYFAFSEVDFPISADVTPSSEIEESPFNILFGLMALVVVPIYLRKRK